MKIIEVKKNLCNSELTVSEEERLIAIMKALGNSVRYEIVKFLAAHSGCITKDIVGNFNHAQSTISQHLKVLKEAGIIRGIIEGPATNYCLNKKILAWFKSIVNQKF